MAEEAFKHQRLPGTGRTFVEYTRLYLAEDHLLQVSTIWTYETYKRFYFRDIQAIVIHQNSYRGIWCVIWGLCALLFLLVAAVTDGAASITMATVGGLFLLILAINYAMGPTVVTTLRTAVQAERLRSLHRLPNARKIVQRLQPLIAQAQQPAEPAHAPAGVAAAPAAPTGPAPQSPPPGSGTESAPPS